MIYLLHFSRPISPAHTCQHYIGYTNDLAGRIAAHRAGNGARLCEVAAERHIGFVVVRVWVGDRTLERMLKNRKEAPALCPICSPETWQKKAMGYGPSWVPGIEVVFDSPPPYVAPATVCPF